MTVEFLVLGIVVVLVGASQIYFRYFSGGDDPDAAEARRQVPTRRGTPAGPVGRFWGSIAGIVGVILGVVLIVLGVLGRG
jgi:hypothetical protein